eukprot:COSAG01_NODE_4270_length_5189_cov_2.508242_4_plen_76_part_00
MCACVCVSGSGRAAAAHPVVHEVGRASAAPRPGLTAVPTLRTDRQSQSQSQPVSLAGLHTAGIIIIIIIIIIIGT